MTSAFVCSSTILIVLSSFAIISLKKRKVDALLLLSSCCSVFLPRDAAVWSGVCDRVIYSSC